MTASDVKDVENISETEFVNKYANLGLTDEEADFFDNFDPKERKKLLWKVDLRLVPFLALLYLAAHIDRANIGNAKIEGMDKDLGLTGIQYNIAVSLFFIPYILLEVPSNVILKKFQRPSTYMAILVVSWGIIMTCTGFVHNFTGLLVCRIVLGIAEAGFFPGAVFLLTQWYAVSELQTRIALFYMASALSGAFSGLLAFAISGMNGIGGKSGWAWIFILEGGFTVLLGISTYFFMPDSPSLSGRWMTEKEIKYLNLQNCIREGGRTQEKVERFRWSELGALLTDYKVYLQAWILFTASTCAYGLKFTMPSITKNMGFSSSHAQLMTMPPYVAGAISAYCFSKLSDRFMWRAPFVVIPLCIIVTGFAILLPLAPHISSNIGPCFFGVILICVGQYPINPAGSAWISGNLAGRSKKAMGVALNIALGNCGGLVGSHIFLDNEKPGYPTGFSVGLAFALCAIVSTLFLEFSYWRINKQRAALDEHEIRAQYTDEQLALMGDKSPLFKHQL